MLHKKSYTRAVWLPLLMALALLGSAAACSGSDDGGATSYWSGPRRGSRKMSPALSESRRS